jgi:hypothetical protein
MAAPNTVSAVRGRVGLPLAFYGGLTLLLGMIVTSTVHLLIPGWAGKHVTHDAEGYLMAVGLAAWIEFVRPRLARSRHERLTTLAAAVASFVVFLVLYRSRTIPEPVTMLNEAFLAIAFLVPYAQPLRRPPTWVAAVGALAVLALVVAVDHSGLAWLVADLVEALVMLVLGPIALDVTDRGILRPGRPSPVGVRVTWWALMVVLPLTVTAASHLEQSGPFSLLRLADQGQEAFVAVLLIGLYFAARGRTRPTWSRTPFG